MHKAKAVLVATVITMGSFAVSAGTASAAPESEHYTVNSQSQASDCYVQVYQLPNHGGQAACINDNMSNLDSWSWANGVPMNDSISSLEFDRICTIDLYSDANYRGAHSHWTRSEHVPGARTFDSTLANNRVGDNRTSSIKISCSISV